MKPRLKTAGPDAAAFARSRMERRGKRRIAKDIVARGLRRRQGLARAVLSGGAAAAIAAVASLFAVAIE